MKPKTEELEVFLAVVDSGGFSAAANQLEMQVAKVSRLVASLEQKVGANLLHRTTRRVEPTQEGVAYANTVRAGLLLITEAQERLSSQKDLPVGRLRVDAASTVMTHQLVPLVKGFQTQYPGIELELATHENIIDLVEKRTDVAIRVGSLKNSNLHARMLGRSPLKLVASPEYLEQFGEPTNAAELLQHKFIGFAGQAHLNKWPLFGGALEPEFSNVATSGEVVRQLCIAGMGITLLSQFTVGKDIATGRLVSLCDGDIETPHPRELVQAVYYRNSSISPRIKVFLDYIESRLKL
ncbi:LysR family transcriptional regulator [Photobacterium sanctipauli]|uniref:LysR family transcriptional regulator n=2 Tax=Photobacterium sanctipauli TaxID=1342794 RepID=A0A2T3NX89_9GAMM|nr:LysR substrate-binding domain-containing protein [Photobacterium sanctipauli]PSW20885.1 LysR family transcriptional regulator [Photobacterium sanctipauli]